MDVMHDDPNTKVRINGRKKINTDDEQSLYARMHTDTYICTQEKNIIIGSFQVY